MARAKTGFNQANYYKEWRLKNKKKMKAYMKQYRKDHPAYVEQQRKLRHKPNGYIARRKKKVA